MQHFAPKDYLTFCSRASETVNHWSADEDIIFRKRKPKVQRGNTGGKTPCRSEGNPSDARGSKQGLGNAENLHVCGWKCFMLKEWAVYISSRSTFVAAPGKYFSQLHQVAPPKSKQEGCNQQEITHTQSLLVETYESKTWILYIMQTSSACACLCWIENVGEGAGCKEAELSQK